MDCDCQDGLYGFSDTHGTSVDRLGYWCHWGVDSDWDFFAVLRGEDVSVGEGKVGCDAETEATAADEPFCSCSGTRRCSCGRRGRAGFRRLGVVAILKDEL